MNNVNNLQAPVYFILKLGDEKSDVKQLADRTCSIKSFQLLNDKYDT